MQETQHNPGREQGFPGAPDDSSRSRSSFQPLDSLKSTSKGFYLREDACRFLSKWGHSSIWASQTHLRSFARLTGEMAPPTGRQMLSITVRNLQRACHAITGICVITVVVKRGSHFLLYMLLNYPSLSQYWKKNSFWVVILGDTQF